MQKSLSEKKKLPHGWRQVALEKIASVISGQSPTSDTYRKEPEGLPFFQGKAGFGQVSPTARVWCVAPKTIAKSGDILISVRAPVGPTNVADVECCIGRGLAAIRCGNSVERDFVLFFMKFHEHEIAQMGTGSTFGAISRKHLLNIQIPLPPLPEQKRVVAVLNKQMAAVEKARVAALERVEAVLALPSAWLREVFSFGGGGLPRGWRWQKLGSISEVISGQSPPSYTYRKSPEGLPFFQGKADFGPKNPVARVYCVAPKKVALPGDILISVRAPVGPTNLADIECSIGRGLAIIRCGKQTDKEFVLSFLKFHEKEISQMGSGSTFQSINREHLLNLEIPLPPLTDQKRLVSALNAKMDVTDQIRVAAEAELEAITALPAALLREAFSGAL